MDCREHFCGSSVMERFYMGFDYLPRHIPIPSVIGGFACHDDVVRMRFCYSSVSDAMEFAFGSELLYCGCAHIPHAGSESAEVLMHDVF